jgi:prepilin-type N-terminal cleavage/methylation domain-containing protein
MHRRRRGYTIVELVVAVSVATILTAGVAVGMRGGAQAGSDRHAQAEADAVLDAAAIEMTLTGRLPAHGMQLARRLSGGVATVDAPAVATELATSVVLVPDAGIVAVASLSADGSCWMARWDLNAELGQPMRVYGLVPASGVTSCSGTLSGALSVDEDRGRSWSRPVILP